MTVCAYHAQYLKCHQNVELCEFEQSLVMVCQCDMPLQMAVLMGLVVLLTY